MAAGKFTWFTSGLKYMMEGRINLAGGAANGSAATPLYAIPMHDNYSPSTASHSALAQIVAFQATASETVVNAIALASVAVTQSGVDTVKLDADNISGFSSDGSTIGSFKWLVIYAQSASGGGGQDNLLVGFIDMDTTTASSSAGNSTQVNITWSADGIGKLRGNP